MAERACTGSCRKEREEARIKENILRACIYEKDLQ